MNADKFRNRAMAWWVHRLGLQDWYIEVKDGPLPPGEVASTDSQLEWKRAIITINPEAFESPDHACPDEVLVVHELLHLVFTGPHDVANEAIERLAGDGVVGSYMKGCVNREFERAIDGLAVALSEAHGVLETSTKPKA